MLLTYIKTTKKNHVNLYYQKNIYYKYYKNEIKYKIECENKNNYSGYPT